MTLRPFVSVLLASACAVLSACDEKKTEPVAKAEPVAAKPPEAPKPPVVAEPKAAKECAAPLEPQPGSDVTLGGRAAELAGYKLRFKDKDADGSLVLGVLGATNDDSGENMVALKKYLKFFKDEKADAIVVTGDVGEKAGSITRVLKTLAESKLPVLVMVGNAECRAEYTNGVNAAKTDAPNIVNLNEVREVDFPELTLVSLPGYHDPKYLHCANGTGCVYYRTTLDDVVRVAKDSKAPVLLVSHGPPHGKGNLALDYATAAGGVNVGDPNITRVISDNNIAFSLSSNIKEAGNRATTDVDGTVLVKEGAPSKTLYVATGPADTVGWEMNDGTNSAGNAVVFTLKGAEASYKVLRLKPLNGAEKAEAKKLAPAMIAEEKSVPQP